MNKRNKNSAGGSATAGGVNFQAAVTAIINVQMARGRPLGWLQSLPDVPIAVDGETGGSGDDIACTLSGGTVVEIQVKKGLAATERLWAALSALAKGVTDCSCDYGILVVCPSSSTTVRDKLARDIERVGSGRTDNLSDTGKKWLSRLQQTGLSAQEVCKKISIQTVSALTFDQASVQAAKAELGHICKRASQIESAWDAIYRDASDVMEHRSRRQLSDISGVLVRAGIVTSEQANAGSLPLLNKLTSWNHETSRTFSIFGVARRLEIDTDWIELSARPRSVQAIKKNQNVDLAKAIEAYHSWDRVSKDKNDRSDGVKPETLGRFIKRGIVVAGPGMGKTTLLRRITRRYSEDNIPVLSVRLSAVAADMKGGASFEDSVFRHGLDGSGLPPDKVREAGISNWLLLGDGLDECGEMQERVADGISRFAMGYPDSRVLITTRPVGYAVNHFTDWRHYDLLPLDPSHAAADVSRLWNAIAGPDDTDDQRRSVCKRELENKSVSETVGRTPMMLGMAAAILARGRSLGGTREALFEQIFALIDQAPARSQRKPASGIVLSRFLDLFGWLVTRTPLAPVPKTLEACGSELSTISGEPLLPATEKAEQYIAYWEDAGLIEKVGQDTTQVYCFVHKAFGEYLAARHLCRLVEDDRLDEVKETLHQPQWENVLRFAGGLGLGEFLCSLFIGQSDKDESWHLRLVDMVQIIAEAEPEVSHELREAILADAFAVVSDKVRQDVFPLGFPLAACAERYPDEVARHAAALRQSNQIWTRLVAWNCLLSAGPEHYAIDELISVLEGSVDDLGAGLKSSLGGGLILDRGERHELGQKLALEACVAIHENASEEIAASLIPKIINHDNLDSVGFYEKAQKLISERNWPYKIDYKWENRNLFKVPKGFEEAETTKDLFVLDALGAQSVSEATDESPKPLLHLSLFVKASHWWEIPINDCWAWTKDFDPAGPLEVIRAVAELSGADRDALRNDAIAAKRYILGAKEEERLDWLWQRRISQTVEIVDCDEIDWTRAKDLVLDEALVERALYHPSRWTVWMAANIIESRLEPGQLQQCISEMYQNGRGYTLWAASAMVKSLPSDLAISMTVERANEKLVWGARHLFTTLCELNPSITPELLSALKNGLSAPLSETAKAAAELLEYLASENTTELLPLIKEAFAYWQEHEEPYPKNGGVIPDSPREGLLAAWIKIEPLEFSQIKSLLNDDRSDVRDKAKHALKDWIERDKDRFAAFIADLLKGDINAQTLGWLLKEEVLLSAADIALVENILTSKSERLRYNAMTILASHYLNETKIIDHANKLIDDPVEQVQSLARRLLREAKSD